MRVFSAVETPIGRMFLTHTNGTLEEVSFEGSSLSEVPCPDEFHKPFDAYFAGSLSALQQIPIKISGSDFEEQVWKALLTIPVGTTCSYAELAEKVGGRNYSRAVGMANGRNPLAIVIPCHRVIGADGTLTGYAWGLDRKKWLLQHEGWSPPQGQLL